MASHDQFAPLLDRFDRKHNNLRISVTDRCNIRCFYCMPNENVVFKPRADIMTFEEIERFTYVCSRMGVDKLRLTGGEPLVRANLTDLVRRLAAIEGIRDIAMTTNGLLLADHAEALRQAGLHRLNISLDGVSEETFQRVARRSGVQRVLDGVTAAREAGFQKIRLNAVAIRGVTEGEILPLAEFARTNEIELRFIEFMPLDAEGNWKTEDVIPGSEILRKLESEFGTSAAAPRPDLSQPAFDYRFDNGAVVGLINPVSEPFCGSCNRLRITAEGQVRNCLFSTTEWDARELLRNQGSDEELADLIRACVTAKKAGHGIDDEDFVKPDRAMYQIGG